MLHDVLGSLQVQQIGSLSHWDPNTVLSLGLQWSGSGGIEAYLSGQLASVSPLTLLVASSGLKIVPKRSYNVTSGSLSLCSLTHSVQKLMLSRLV